LRAKIFKLFEVLALGQVSAGDLEPEAFERSVIRGQAATAGLELLHRRASEVASAR
jgi:hypothetical protein